MGLKLASIHSLEFTHVSDARDFQAGLYLSRGCLRQSSGPEVLGWNTFCVLHATVLIQPSRLINPVSVSSQEFQLPAGESPGDPGLTSSLFLPVLPSLQLGPGSKLLVLWTIVGQSLSCRGNVGQCLFSQIRFNESRGCVIKGSSQEVGLELSDDCLNGVYLVIEVKKLNT